jgi:hypothetical protein
LSTDISEVRTASIIRDYFTWQYIPEDNSEHHTRCRENLKSHIGSDVIGGGAQRQKAFSLSDKPPFTFENFIVYMYIMQSKHLRNDSWRTPCFVVPQFEKRI